MSNFTAAELNNKTTAELRAILLEEFDVRGTSKWTKAVLVDTILENQGDVDEAPAAPQATAAAPMTHMERLRMRSAVDSSVRAVDTDVVAVREDSGEITTVIQVKCGANSGDFPVVGKTVSAVMDFLREVLNIDRLAEPLVNGNPVATSYVLTAEDSLEFLKSAGSKGC